NLERDLSTLIRKAVKELISEPSVRLSPHSAPIRQTFRSYRLSEKKSVKASADNLADYLGVPKYRYGEVEDKDQIGIVTGLAWTATSTCTCRKARPRRTDPPPASPWPPRSSRL